MDRCHRLRLGQDWFSQRAELLWPRRYVSLSTLGRLRKEDDQEWNIPCPQQQHWHRCTASYLQASLDQPCESDQNCRQGSDQLLLARHIWLRGQCLEGDDQHYFDIVQYCIRSIATDQPQHPQWLCHLSSNFEVSPRLHSALLVVTCFLIAEDDQDTKFLSFSIVVYNTASAMFTDVGQLSDRMPCTACWSWAIVGFLAADGIFLEY